jgi:acyl carrier protein
MTTSYAHIQETLVGKYGVQPDLVTPEATLAELGLDSLSVAELMFDVSDHYGIDIPDERVNFNTLGEAVALVDECVKAKGGG